MYSRGNVFELADVDVWLGVVLAEVSDASSLRGNFGVNEFRGLNSAAIGRGPLPAGFMGGLSMSLQRTIRLCLAALLCSLLVGSVVSAQAPAAKPGFREYKPSTTMFETERDERDFYLKQVSLVLRGRIPWGDPAKVIVDKWFDKKLFLEFTMQENWAKLPELRAKLLKEAKSATSPPAGAYLKARMLSAMTTLSGPKLNVHPAVRYNAMLLIGDLNDMDAGSRDAQERRVVVADPMVKAFDTLMSAFTNTKMDAIRVAAQVGILRHAVLDHARPQARRISNQKRTAVVTAMLDLVKSEPPAGRTVDGHTWMQRRGIEIIAALGAVGVVAQVHPTLESIVADDTKPMSLRCTAAEALAHWKPASKTKFNAQTLSETLGRLGGQALVNELAIIGKLQESETLKQQIRELIADSSTAMTNSTPGAATASGGGMQQMMMMGADEVDDGQDETEDAMDMQSMFGDPEGGGMSGLMGNGSNPLLAAGPEDPRVTRSRRRLKHQLACVQAGLDGISKVTAVEPQKASIEKVILAINAAYASTDPIGGDLPALEESIKEGLSQLAFLMPNVAADNLSALPELDPSATGETAVPPVDAAAPGDPAAADPLPTELGLPGEPDVLGDPLPAGEAVAPPGS